MNMYVYIGIAFAVGFILAWAIQMLSISKINKEYKSNQGLLESEKLKKETAQKENAFLIQSSDAALHTTREKLRKANELIKEMDNDILLMQKSNEETEAMLAKGDSLIPELKRKLIEANNTIARLKGLHV
jgi:peptidoglycan hydrolase CwlO-like protein